MTTTRATRTYEELRRLFATRGLPEQLVSDNGYQFTADEFGEFLRSNGIKHIRSAPYHPATNGLAERFVQTFKQALRAALTEIKSISWKLANFLMAYRTTPLATTGETPAMLLMGRNIRTELDVGQTVVARDYRRKAEESGFPESLRPTTDPCPMKSESHQIQYGDDMSINSEKLP